MMAMDDTGSRLVRCLGDKKWKRRKMGKDGKVSHRLTLLPPAPDRRARIGLTTRLDSMPLDVGDGRMVPWEFWSFAVPSEKKQLVTKLIVQVLVLKTLCTLTYPAISYVIDN